MSEVAELPFHSDQDLSAATPRQLIDWLIQHEDRAPRALIDECARRSESLVQQLMEEYDANADVEGDADYWWLQLHAVNILGLIASEPAGLMLVKHMHRMSLDDDEILQDWLAGRWPELFMNKPAAVSTALRELIEDRDHEWYIRYEAMTAFVALARKAGNAELEDALTWLAGRAANEREEWDLRLFAGNLLLDFPRAQNRDLLLKLARRQKHIGRIFGVEEVAQAFMAMKDNPPWEVQRFDPWAFYEPGEITKRQQRWAEEEETKRKLEQRWISEGKHLEDVPQPLIRDIPKAGRNDPCPCGSGKKYKKCCLNK